MVGRLSLPAYLLGGGSEIMPEWDFDCLFCVLLLVSNFQKWFLQDLGQLLLGETIRIFTSQKLDTVVDIEKPAFHV